MIARLLRWSLRNFEGNQNHGDRAPKESTIYCIVNESLVLLSADHRLCNCVQFQKPGNISLLEHPGNHGLT
jgi:hypothetical protein